MYCIHLRIWVMMLCQTNISSSGSHPFIGGGDRVQGSREQGGGGGKGREMGAGKAQGSMIDSKHQTIFGAKNGCKTMPCEGP